MYICLEFIGGVAQLSYMWNIFKSRTCIYLNLYLNEPGSMSNIFWASRMVTLLFIAHIVYAAQYNLTVSTSIKWISQCEKVTDHELKFSSIHFKNSEILFSEGSFTLGLQCSKRLPESNCITKYHLVKQFDLKFDITPQRKQRGSICYFQKC